MVTKPEKFESKKQRSAMCNKNYSVYLENILKWALVNIPKTCRLAWLSFCILEITSDAKFCDVLFDWTQGHLGEDSQHQVHFHLVTGAIM